MAESIVKKFEDLITTGTQLVPLGGFEFSGYNARLQNKYLEWRKGCLETLEQSGPIGFPYKNKIIGDQNGGYFFQSSAQLILTCIKELHEKLKSSPELAAAAATAPPAVAASPSDSGSARVLKPPPKPATAAAAPAPAPAPAKSDGAVGNKVYVVAEQNDPLKAQLSQFLSDIGLEEIALNRAHGQMLALEDIQERPDVRFAFFVLNSDDMTYAMFELGHFVGKLGKGRVCVLHMSDVSFPKSVPGASVKSIVVKLEEASLGIMKELKGVGYQINF
ncbi:MAG TPA: TIR domain-containing protein [Bacteroidota bacterium]|nr:TIR domain-containing protein [Bacteroidota bacterium]